MFNKYWIISWWYLFDLLDKKSHETASKIIWECLTIWANIQYFSPLKSIDSISFETKILWQTKKSISIFISLLSEEKIITTWTFTFAKI